MTWPPSYPTPAEPRSGALTMILTTLLATASLFGGPTPVQSSQSSQSSMQSRLATSDDTAEGAEILRRILVDSLDDTFDRKERGESTTRVRGLNRFGGVVTTLWAGRDTVQHSRGFHMPEVGLFFAFDAALPVVSRDEDKGVADKGTKAKDDEWERARQAVRGGGETNVLLFRNGPAKESEIDPKAIDQVIDQVLRTLARHAGRVEGLTSRETITVALRLSGRGRTVWSGAHDWNDWNDDGEHEGELEGHVKEERDAEEMAQGAYNLVLAGGSSAREQSLVIRIGLGDLASSGEANLDSLRQRAQINRY